MRWLQILWELSRDVGMTGFGAWVIYTQVEAAAPSAILLVVALGCITPAARSAVTTILSGPGLSSHSQPPPAERPPPSSLPGAGTGERD